MVNTKIRLIMLFEAKDGEKLYTVSKNPNKKTRSWLWLIIAKFRFKLEKSR